MAHATHKIAVSGGYSALTRRDDSQMPPKAGAARRSGHRAAGLQNICDDPLRHCLGHDTGGCRYDNETDVFGYLSLLQDGLALEVKQTCFDIQKTMEQHESTREAMISASENRDLNVRAYQEELVETQDVIEAQLLEALLSGQHQRVLYDHINAQAKLDFVLGTDAWELAERLQ